MKKDSLIYLAYGSNLNKSQMAHRCPKAQSIGWINLPDYRLVFKGVADIIPAKGMTVPVGLWEITDDCEAALDIYEGYPRLYRKEYFRTAKGHTLMAYVMNSHGLSSPSDYYFKSIEDGYQDFGIDTGPLYEALKFSTKNDTGNGYIPKRLRG